MRALNQVLHLGPMQAQVPKSQTDMSGHLVPHPPQLFLSNNVSTHFVPQTLSPAAHAHAPPKQPAPVAHFFPQPPQLLMSLFSSTQTLLHLSGCGGV